MKRSAVFVVQFALAPMLSGPFVVSATGRASAFEWAHVITGVITIYFIFGLLLLSAKHRKMRLPAGVAFAIALLEAIPGMPQLHAVVSPVLFAALTWVAIAALSDQSANRPNSRWIFTLPALLLLPVLYGVRYRHQTSGIVAHLGAAVPVGGLLLIFCMVMNERQPAESRFRGFCNLTIAAVLFQIVMGIAVWTIRLLDLDGGLVLAMARTAHITGAAALLATTTMLAIQYRNNRGRTA